tara:strand:+ start:127 stop:300 length:174 start_codon:yes stop_codon:yes gene_type:complete
MTGIDDWWVFVKARLKVLTNLNIKVMGNNKIEKMEILVLSQNFGLIKIIYYYLYIFF